AELLSPMEPYFESMAGASVSAMGPSVEPPALSANVNQPGLDIYVDLADLIDIDAEIVKKQKELDKLDGMIAGKKKKLENENFISRAPAEVVEKEKASLKELEDQRAGTAEVLERLKGA
ncbi:MAG: valine--tRNA ligase, partial [Pirellulales bacterium]|nr:valine--tRNA ligase [Pirellulales bacterium]